MGIMIEKRIDDFLSNIDKKQNAILTINLKDNKTCCFQYFSFQKKIFGYGINNENIFEINIDCFIKSFIKQMIKLVIKSFE